MTNGFCKRLCSVGQYLDMPNDKCEPCNRNCESCFGPLVTNCESCKSNSTFVSDTTYCKPICLRGFYADDEICKACESPCLTCDKSTEVYCKECIVNFVLEQNGKCNCPKTAGYYELTGPVACLRCNDVCQTCTNNSMNGCVTCKAGYRLNPAPSLNEANCVQACPEDSFFDEINLVCTNCNQQCLACTSSAADACLSCHQGRGLFGKTCLEVCPPNYALVAEKRLCLQCEALCLHCNPMNLDECTECGNEMYLYLGDCTIKCPIGTYPATVAGIRKCENCPDRCETCNEEGKCTKCSSGMLLGGLCASSCPQGYKVAQELGDPDKKYCDKIFCNENCDICKDSQDCLTCKTQTSTGTVVITAIGLCIPCTEQNGLRLNGDVCEEICGDGILLRHDPKASVECDDGNTADGDGCSSSCKIEANFACTRQFELTKQTYQSKDKCRPQTDKKLERDLDNPQRFGYYLKFSRGVYLLIDEFKRMFNIMVIDESKFEFIIPPDIVMQDSKNYYITVNEKQFSQNVNGKLLVRKKKEFGKPALFKDDEFLDVDINGLSADFIYDKSREKNVQGFVKLTDSINGFMESGWGQAALIVASMNPIFFNMMVNVLQKFVYFRILNIVYAENVQFFFKVFGSAWGINLGKTDYDPKSEISGFDKMLGITSAEMVLPDRFKVVKLSNLFIKASLPSLVVMFVTYTLALLTLIFEKYGKKIPEKRLAKKKLLKKLLEINEKVRSKLVWTSIIRSNFMSFQNFTFGIFLNFFTLSNAKYVTMFSSVLAFLGLVFAVCNIVFYAFIVRNEKKPGGVYDEKFDILNGAHDNFIAQHYKIYKYLVKPTLLAMFMCQFYYVPLVPIIVLLVLSVGEQLVICLKPIYKDKKDNLKIRIEGGFFAVLSVFPAVFYAIEPLSKQGALTGIFMISSILLLLVANLVMSIVMEKKTL